MRYATGTAFRVALESRLRTESLNSAIPLVRLRKTVAFDRLLARMVRTHPDGWLLKGGLALQVRLADRSRVTKDVDLLLFGTDSQVYRMVTEAGRLDLGDWFDFEVSPPRSLPGNTGSRLKVVCRLDGREFERFHVDVGIGDPVVEPPDLLAVTGLLEFADLPPTMMPCYPLTQHIAEKLHAFTQPRGDRENSRVKDLVDLILISEEYEIPFESLSRAVDATFSKRLSHPQPAILPDPPLSWAAEYRRMAVDLRAGAATLAEANQRVREFLQPVLSQTGSGIWRPSQREWV